VDSSHSFATALVLVRRIIEVTVATLDATVGTVLRGWMLFGRGTEAPAKPIKPTLTVNLGNRQPCRPLERSAQTALRRPMRLLVGPPPAVGLTRAATARLTLT
jgi:hypothetical protein